MDQLAYAIRRGGAAIESNTDRRVPWWSLTKTVLAAATLKLVDQQWLQLDARLPGRDCTIRQLLQHTAGVRNYGGQRYQDAVAAGESAWPVSDLLARVGADTPMYPPGSAWSYSNVGYLFIRQLIEQRLDTDIGSALRSLLFDPLELASPRIATCRADLDGTLWHNPTRYDPEWVYHGLLIGSPADAVRLLDHLLDGPFLSSAARQAMLTVYPLGAAVAGRPWTATGYGLGLMIGALAGAGRAVGHSGAGVGSVAALYRLPDLPVPVTVAAFAAATDEGVAEAQAIRIATQA